jgi:hypothetical protein
LVLGKNGKNKSNPKGKTKNLTADYGDKRGSREKLLAASSWPLAKPRSTPTQNQRQNRWADKGDFMDIVELCF